MIDLSGAIEIIEEFEGYSGVAYLDSGAVATIGYGTVFYPDGSPVKLGDICTHDQAHVYLIHTLDEDSGEMSKSVHVPINNHEQNALLSFMYNVGIGAFQDSTLLKLLNLGAPKDDVANQFLRWCHVGSRVIPGLLDRRKKEAKLFLA